MTNFTNDEMNLMCIYSAGSSRAGLIQKLTEMKKYLERDEVQLLKLTGICGTYPEKFDSMIRTMITRKSRRDRLVDGS